MSILPNSHSQAQNIRLLACLSPVSSVAIFLFSWCSGCNNSHCISLQRNQSCWYLTHSLLVFMQETYTATWMPGGDV